MERMVFRFEKKTRSWIADGYFYSPLLKPGLRNQETSLLWKLFI